MFLMIRLPVCGLFGINICLCASDRNCMQLERIKWELMSLSSMPFCVLAASLTLEQVCVCLSVCVLPFVSSYHSVTTPSSNTKTRSLFCHRIHIDENGKAG